MAFIPPLPVYIVLHGLQPIVVSRVFASTWWAAPVVWALSILQFPTEHLPLVFPIIDALGPLLNLSLVILFICFFTTVYRQMENKKLALAVGPGLFFSYLVVMGPAVLDLGTPKPDPGEQAIQLEDPSYHFWHVFTHIVLTFAFSACSFLAVPLQKKNEKKSD
jgi:hypothetical protein